MVCQKCGSENIIASSEQVSAKTKGSLIRLLLNLLLIIFTGGIWLIVMLCGRRKAKTKFKYKTVCVCQACANRWYAK